MNLAAMLALGAGLVSWCFRARAASPADRVYRCALSALLGACCSSAVWSALYLAHVARLAPALDVLVFAAGVVAVWRTRGAAFRLRARPRTPAPRWLAAATIVAAAIFFALFVEHLVRYPDGGWDAIAIWNARARFLWQAPPSVAFSSLLAIHHPDYPLLLPGLVVQGFRVCGSDCAGAHAAVALFFAAGCTALAGSAVARGAGSLRGLSAVLALAGTPALLQLGATECADLPLATLLLAACSLLARRRPRATMLAGLCAALGAWTKNEGALYLGAMLLACGATVGFRRAGRFLLGALPVAPLLGLFKLAAPVNDLVALTNASSLAARMLSPSRYWLVATQVAARALRFDSWGLTGPGTALAAAGLARRSFTLPLRVAAALLAVVCAIYVATPIDERLHLDTSLDRLLLQLFPCAIYASCAWRPRRTRR